MSDSSAEVVMMKRVWTSPESHIYPKVQLPAQDAILFNEIVEYFSLLAVQHSVRTASSSWSAEASITAGIYHGPGFQPLWPVDPAVRDYGRKIAVSRSTTISNSLNSRERSRSTTSCSTRWSTTPGGQEHDAFRRESRSAGYSTQIDFLHPTP